MIVLDTNVLSEVMKTSPDAAVAAWMRSLGRADMATTAINEAEVLMGIALLPPGKRRVDLVNAALAVIGLFAGRILSFDSAAAVHFADIMETRRRAGRRVAEMDAMIAAIARSRSGTLATRNTADFDGIGLTLANPWGVEYS
jgi:toxin FitB